MRKKINCKPKLGCRPKPICKPKSKDNYLFSRAIVFIMILSITFIGGIFLTKAAYTWTDPNPDWVPIDGGKPTGNVYNPINTGSVTQTKTGNLKLYAPDASLNIQSSGGGANIFMQAIQGVDTRIGSSNNVPLSFYTNGTEKMKVDTAGNITIVGNASAVGDIRGGRLCIGSDCRNAWPSGGTGQWTTSGSNIYYNGGSVGIGTTTPGVKFDVVGDVRGSRLCIGSDCRSSWPSGGITDWSQALSGTIAGYCNTGTGPVIALPPAIFTGGGWYCGCQSGWDILGVGGGLNPPLNQNSTCLKK